MPAGARRVFGLQGGWGGGGGLGEVRGGGGYFRQVGHFAACALQTAALLKNMLSRRLHVRT